MSGTNKKEIYFTEKDKNSCRFYPIMNMIVGSFSDNIISNDVKDWVHYPEFEEDDLDEEFNK